MPASTSARRRCGSGTTWPLSSAGAAGHHASATFRPMPSNPLDDFARGLSTLRERLSQGGDPVEWLNEQLARPEPPRPLEELQAELDALVGLETVKEQVRALSRSSRCRRGGSEHGLPEVATSQHLVFLGNPGTGKTTVARLLAQMYRAMGLLKRGHLVEVDRAGLVGEYVGTTAIKTDRASGGRSTACCSSTRRTRSRRGDERLDFGPEAIETLLKRMEDYRHRLVVIVAGYPRLMHHLLDSNPGLRSRFSREIVFPDYSTDELRRDHGHASRARTSTRSARARRGRCGEILDGVERGEGFGNARFSRTLFEQALNAQALRLAGEDTRSAGRRRRAQAPLGVGCRRGRAGSRRVGRAAAPLAPPPRRALVLVELVREPREALARRAVELAPVRVGGVEVERARVPVAELEQVRGGLADLVEVVAVGLLGLVALGRVVAPLHDRQRGQELGLLALEQIELARDQILERAAPQHEAFVAAPGVGSPEPRVATMPPLVPR